jgi:hypothetical protein
MNFKPKSFRLTPLEMADLATLEIPLQTLVTEGRRLCPRTIYFRDNKLYVGLTLGIKNNF